MKRQFVTIHCTINGKEAEAAVDVRASLADMLRGEYGLSSVKKGCEAGECGACNVIIDGECYNSCIYMAIWADGKNIRTVEGLEGPNGELSEIQRLFLEEGAVQCGFCTSGFLMTATAILESGEKYSREELRKELSGHLCRCTGYENIFNAVEKAVIRKLAIGSGP
jgi:carbon-monoxide dehydrogenase small subunit